MRNSMHWRSLTIGHGVAVKITRTIFARLTVGVPAAFTKVPLRRSVQGSQANSLPPSKDNQYLAVEEILKWLIAALRLLCSDHWR